MKWRRTLFQKLQLFTMNKTILFIAAFFTVFLLKAQELKCDVEINAEKTGESNLAVFKNLKQSVIEFMNQTKWTNTDFNEEERINCSVFITINSYDNNSFSGSIQVQSSRPVFGSTMITPVFNFNDTQLSFTYQDFEPLVYSQNNFSSNLVSVLSYYAYTILGLDADTFQKEGGTSYFEEANRIVNTAQQENSAGWRASDGSHSRYRLNADLLANAFVDYRNTMYAYHRLGLDIMYKDPAAGKKIIADAIISLKKMNDTRPNSLLNRVFFDAKTQEIEQIFSGGPSVPISDLVDTLNKIAPLNSENWSNIKF